MSVDNFSNSGFVMFVFCQLYCIFGTHHSILWQGLGSLELLPVNVSQAHYPQSCCLVLLLLSICGYFPTLLFSFLGIALLPQGRETSFFPFSPYSSSGFQIATFGFSFIVLLFSSKRISLEIRSKRIRGYNPMLHSFLIDHKACVSGQKQTKKFPHHSHAFA